MADVFVRRPFQQGQAFRFGQEVAQAFARPVPVDQKHQARAEELQKIAQRLAAGQGDAAEAEVINAAFHAAILARAGVFPVHPLAF